MCACVFVSNGYCNWYQATAAEATPLPTTATMQLCSHRNHRRTAASAAGKKHAIRLARYEQLMWSTHLLTSRLLARIRIAAPVLDSRTRVFSCFSPATMVSALHQQQQASQASTTIHWLVDCGMCASTIVSSISSSSSNNSK